MTQTEYKPTDDPRQKSFARGEGRYLRYLTSNGANTAPNVINGLPRQRLINNMFYTYVLRSQKDRKWYTGYTNDLRKRFKEHTHNKVTSTKNRGPFELIYYEACVNKEDAFVRERYLKTGMGKRYLNNRLKRFLSLTGCKSNPDKIDLSRCMNCTEYYDPVRNKNKSYGLYGTIN